MTTIQVPLDVEQDSTDLHGPFDVAYLWDSSDPTMAAAARNGDDRQSLTAVGDIPPPPNNDKYWQYGWTMLPLEKNWVVGIAMASHWKPFPSCSSELCTAPQWELDPVRNAMKFYPQGRTWGTGPNAPKADWSSELSKYILKNSTAKISTSSCFKVIKKSTATQIGFRMGFEGTSGAGDISGNFQISSSMSDACQDVARTWKPGYPNKPVTFDPDLGLGECEDLTGQCGIVAYRSEIRGDLTFKFYNDKNQKDYKTVNMTVLCDWHKRTASPLI
jgi:hypothetical protein